MLKVNKRKGELTLTLTGEATLSTVEEGFAKVTGSLERGAAVETVRLRFRDLEAVDTAFLQLLFAVFKTAEEKCIPVVSDGGSELIDEVLGLLGIESDELCYQTF